jgi:phage repressor protein C with HTH and peptisase S24 domain
MLMSNPSRINADRLKAEMDRHGFSQSSLARVIGVSQATIARLATGAAFGSTHLHRIARELQTTPAYLTGETDDPSEGALPVPTAQSIAAQLGSVLIPQLDIGYSMGGGSVFEDYVQQAEVAMPQDWLRPLIKGRFDELFVARGEGDSMMPTLMDGDLVVVDTAQRQINKQDRLWCLSYGDLGMIKRVRKLPTGGYEIMSDNPTVTSITAYDDEMHVVGRVVWIGRRV